MFSHWQHPLWLILLLTLSLLVGCSESEQPADATTREESPSGGTARRTATRAPSISTSASPEATPVPTATLPPADRLAHAKEIEQLGHWEIAERLYNSLRVHPEHGIESLYQLGKHYQRENQLGEAAALWQEALQRDPDGPLANRIRYRQALVLASIGQHQSAINIWKRFDERNEELSALEDVLAQHMADSYMALGQKAEAIEQQKRIYQAEAAPRVSRAVAARQLGDWHASHGRWSDAMDWYGRTLALSELQSFRARIIASMAEIALKLGRPADAHEQWRLLVTDYSDTPQAITAAHRLAGVGDQFSSYEMADLYFANERWHDAIQNYFAYLENGEDIALAHHKAAQALEAIGNYSGAHQQWREIVVAHPEASELHDTALLNIGRMMLKLGDTNGAMEIWGRVAEEYPESQAAAEALWERGFFLRDHLHQPIAAAREMERLATTCPDSDRVEEALWLAAMLRLEQGETDKARADFSLLANKKGEYMTRALFWAGKLADQTGDETAARRFWSAADPEERFDYYTLRSAALLEQTGWQPRNNQPFARADSPDMDWLYQDTDLPSDSDPYALPDEPLFLRGLALLQVGERDKANDSFRDALDVRATDAEELWAMAYHLREQEMHSISILAARRLMNLLDYHPFNAPLPLAELAYPINFDKQLQEIADEHDLDPLLLAALIYQESRWEPTARSHASARGLTQVIPDTGQWIARQLGDSHYQYAHLDRPLVALKYGGYYLDYVLDKFDDNLFHALAAYNGGPGNISRWYNSDDDYFVKNITFRETRTYVERIYQHWYAYKRIYRDHE